MGAWRSSSSSTAVPLRVLAKPSLRPNLILRPKDSVPKSTDTNLAFMFLKPHANTDEVRNLVRRTLQESGVEVVKESFIEAEKLEEGRITDNHFGSLAKKAMDERPEEAVVQPEAQAAFQEAFGLPWREALRRGLVCNAREALSRLDCSDEALDKLWTPLQMGKGKVKFGSGFYCGHIGALYVINGFYMAMRSMYTQPESSVHWFTVRWRPEELSWEAFRNEVLGATDPAIAVSGSLRGKIHEQWRELGLGRVPHVGENAVHASASALEALVERMNWLGVSPGADPFGRSVLSVLERLKRPTRLLREWSLDPVVSYRGRRLSIFDLFENLDGAACLQLVEELAQAGSEDC